MNILYYTWDEITKDDQIDGLIKLGHNVDVIDYKIKSYTIDGQFMSKVKTKLETKHYDCIYTVNYLPILSKVAVQEKIPYIAWIFDSPCLSTYSEMLYNPYNFVFHFDNSEVEKFRKLGVRNIWHMPLAVNTQRVDGLLAENVQPDEKLCNSGIAFMGTLYNDKNNFFDQINGLSEYDCGYVDGLIQAQLQVLGADIIDESISEEVVADILKHIDFNLDEEITISGRELLLYMIRKKATIVERQEFLLALAQKYGITLYSGSDSNQLRGIVNKGYLNYYNEMPLMFHNTAINLNITLRTIQSGISLRAMDVMGAGGFLLSNYQPELAALFEEGKDMVMYYDRQDLFNKLDYYLLHDEERKQIAKNGKTKIEQEYTYKIQLSKIMELVFEGHVE